MCVGASSSPGKRIQCKFDVIETRPLHVDPVHAIDVDPGVDGPS